MNRDDIYVIQITRTVDLQYICTIGENIELTDDITFAKHFSRAESALIFSMMYAIKNAAVVIDRNLPFSVKDMLFK